MRSRLTSELSLITTLEKLPIPKEDMGLAGLGAAEARDRCFLVLVQFAAIESPDGGAVCLSKDARVRWFLSLITLLFAASAYPSTPSSQEEELYAGLLGWAVILSGYPRPATTPTIAFEPQEFFNENACHHRDCHVWGWYPNTGQDVVYVHDAVRDLIADGADEESLLAASIIVHEFTHYLQAAKRGFAPYRCEEAIKLEREAYGVQNAYIASYGRYMQVGILMHNVGCGGNVSDTTVR